MRRGWCWWCCCWRGKGKLEKGGKKKQFHQRSSKLSDRGNFDPLALLCSPPTIFPSFTFPSLRFLRRDIPSGQTQHLFFIKCYGAAHVSNTQTDHMLLLCVNNHYVKVLLYAKLQDTWNSITFTDCPINVYLLLLLKVDQSEKSVYEYVCLAFLEPIC